MEIKFVNYEPSCESGEGETVWFTLDGTEYFTERWHTRHSSGIDTYDVRTGRAVNLAEDHNLEEDDEEALDTLVEKFCDLVLEAEAELRVPELRRQAVELAIASAPSNLPCTQESGHREGADHRWQECPTYHEEQS